MAGRLSPGQTELATLLLSSPSALIDTIIQPREDT